MSLRQKQIAGLSFWRAAAIVASVVGSVAACNNGGPTSEALGHASSAGSRVPIDSAVNQTSSGVPVTTGISGPARSAPERSNASSSARPDCAAGQFSIGHADASGHEAHHAGARRSTCHRENPYGLEVIAPTDHCQP